MKKFSILFLVFLCLSFNIIGLNQAFAAPKTYKQGIYELTNFNFSADDTYVISNIAKTDSTQVIIFDKNYIPLQTIKLDENTLNLDATIPMKSEYLMVVIGKGEVTITTKNK